MRMNKSLCLIVLAIFATLLAATTLTVGSPGHKDFVKGADEEPIEESQQDKPILWWCPGEDRYFIQYNIEVAPGQSNTDVLAIEAQKNLTSVSVWISPEIDPYISFLNNTTFDKLEAEKRENLTAEIDMPKDVEVGTTYNGTIHIKKDAGNSRTYPKVLKINIEVVNAEELDSPNWKRIM